MKVLEVSSLCKEYPTFHLYNVAFLLEKGVFMGFIGKNGAGKTTTLKSLGKPTFYASVLNACLAFVFAPSERLLQIDRGLLDKDGLGKKEIQNKLSFMKERGKNGS